MNCDNCEIKFKEVYRRCPSAQDRKKKLEELLVITKSCDSCPVREFASGVVKNLRGLLGQQNKGVASVAPVAA